VNASKLSPPPPPLADFAKLASTRNQLRASTRRWAPRLGLSIADQGILSGANLVLNLALARWLAPADYGAYAVGFSVFLFLSGFHNSLILEPMSVLGPARQGRALPTYLGQLIGIHAGLMVVTVIVLVAASFVVGDAALAAALRALALATPLVLLFWLFRRSYYLDAGPLPAAISSAIYASTMLVAAVVLWRLGWLSGPAGLLAMGLGGVVASIWGWRRLQIRIPRDPEELFGGPDATLARHWNFGRWIAAQSLLTLGSTYIQTFLTAGVLGLDAAGMLRAMEVFTLPMTQVITAVGVLTLPILSTEFLSGGRERLRRKGAWVVVLLFGLAAVYEVLLILLSGPVVHVVYGGKFDQVAWLIPIQGLVPIFAALAQGYSLNLRALQKPQHYLIASLVATPVGILSAVVLIQAWGIGGAALSSVLTAAAFALAHYLMYRYWMPAEKASHLILEQAKR
jgi:O-antigen/teichoic acid export membrane protein